MGRERWIAHVPAAVLGDPQGWLDPHQGLPVQGCLEVDLEDRQARPRQGLDHRPRHLHQQEVRNESSTHNVEVPNVSKHEYQLIDISDEGFMSLMDDDGTMKEDLKVPDGEVGEQIREKFDDGDELLITTQSAMGHEQAMSFKVSKE